MTEKELKIIQSRLEELYNEIPEGTGLLDVVREIVELESLLDKEDNQ